MFFSEVETPLGPMIAIADKTHLYLLEFKGTRPINIKAEPGRSDPIQSIGEEIKLYFGGKLREFITPIKMSGTPFQKAVWDRLTDIPHGQTCSYSDVAKAVGNPKAVRAVAQAIGANRFAIVIPCHRVIASNGTLCGYAGGVHRKKALLDSEQMP